MNEAFGSAAGKGANAARALTLLGVESQLLTYAGGMNGEKYLADCRGDGIAVSCVPISGETRICTTIIEDDESVTEIIEPPPTVSATESNSFADQMTRMVENATLLVISGTAVAGEASSRYREYVETAHAFGYLNYLMPKTKNDEIVVICLSGRGDKDLNTLMKKING